MSQAVFSNTTRVLSSRRTHRRRGPHGRRVLPRRLCDAGLSVMSLAELTAAVELLLAEIAQLLA